MTAGKGPDAPVPSPADGPILPVALVSAAVLAYEVCLMRVLLVASWHHFAFLLMSCALLGFGASGTLLRLLNRHVERRGEALMVAFALVAAASMVLCIGLGLHLKVEARFVPALLGAQLGRWLAFWALLTVPFLAGASAIGAALMRAGTRTGRVYAANLLGSSAGALGGAVLCSAVEPAWLPVFCSATAWAGALAWACRTPRRMAWPVLVAAVIALHLWADPPQVPMDQYKRGAWIEQQAAQSSVRRAGRRVGSRALVEAWRGDILHDAPFVAADRVPPPVSVILADGHQVGAVFDLREASEAVFMEGALMALAYGLAPPGPRVALLGETGGQNVWLAALHGAASVDVVQPDRNVDALMRGPLREAGGAVLERTGVRVHLVETRHFIEHSTGPWDLIQISSLESSPAGSGGVGGLAEDHLITVEGLRACLERLSPRGVLAAGRGMQDPPRDDVKLAAALIEALKRSGRRDPGAHLVVVRDFLAVCILARPDPWLPLEIEHLRALCRKRQLTPVWFPGVRPGELNAPDELPAAPDGVGDVHHHAVARLLGPGADGFIAEYPFDVRPPTDDRPFFGDFSRLRSAGALRAAWGEGWAARGEIAFLFVLAAAAAAAATGAALIVLPLLVVRRGAGASGRVAFLLYFGCLGLGYLLLEMVFLSRMARLLGDAVLAAAVTFGGFLLFSGIGSLLSQRVPARARTVGAIVALLVCVGSAETLLTGLPAALGALPPGARLVAAMLLIAPPAFLMGFPMPLGLGRLDGGAVAWAWGVNGFASVLAAPVALAAAMTWGYGVVAGAALALYAIAGLAWRGLD